MNHDDALKNDNFMNVVAHELRSPLTSILGFSELLVSQKSQLPPAMAGYPDIILEEGMRLKGMIQRFLTVTRFESGKVVIGTTLVDVRNFFMSLEPTLAPLCEKKQCTLRISVSDDLAQAQLDTEHIPEVLINLIDNAAKFGPEKQTISLSVNTADFSKHPDMIAVEVADLGPGIAAESLPTIFDKFSKGTNVGLYTCKLIIERLGGTIEVQSDTGHGCRFIFYLPIKPLL